MLTIDPNDPLDFADDDLGPVAPTEDLKAASLATQEKYENMGRPKATGREEKLYPEPCPKCHGTGIYYGFSRYGSVCFKCDGKKILYFKKPRAVREAANQKAKDRKERLANEALAAYEKDHPQLAAWWTGSTFEFAVSMRDAVRKFGALTEGQLGAAMRCAEKFATAKAALEVQKAAQAERANALPTLNVEHITTAFNRARDNNVKRPKMKLFSGTEMFEFSRAPDTGKNPGAIYVNDSEGQYIGKVMGGKFWKSRDCSDQAEAEVIKTCQDPEQAAVAYGKRYGSCSICGRELTNGESIDFGIGPICREKFFG